MFDQVWTQSVTGAAQEAARRLGAAIGDQPLLFDAIFGASDALDALLATWRDDGVPLHNIETVPATNLPDADAAYDASRDTILLSQTLVDTASPERLVDVLLEELGHRLDAALGGGDTPGDEGQALVAALRGEPVPVTQEDFTQATGLEYTTSVNDSGGFEGSSKTLQLETTAGSVITYSYTHYTIPDRFIIRYEGRNIVDTGFTGGTRSGTVQLPAGQSDTVQVIVATDNSGTAWFYSVNAEPQECDDVRPWTISASTEFERNEQTEKCETTGTISVGRTDGAATLIRAVSTTSAAYDQDVLEVKGGQVFSGIGNIGARLFTADFNLNLNTGIAALSNIAQGDFKLAGLSVEFKSMAVLSDTLAFDVRFQMPDAASGLLIETADFYNQALRISSSGAFPVLGFRIDPPGAQEFKLGGFIDVKASNMAIEYRASEDALRFQSKIEFANTSFAKTKKGIDKVEADLSGPNYIQVNSDGDVDVIGTLKAAGNIALFGGWSIQGLEFNINTTTREVGGAGTLGTPFGLKFGEGATARAEVEFVYDPFELDKVGLTIDNLNKPIPAYPAFFFQRIGGSVDNFAPSNNKDIEGNFTIGASLGPKIGGTSLALAQFDAKVTSKFIQGQMTTDILTAKFELETALFDIDLGKFTLVKDVSTAKLDWSKGELSFVGTSNVLDGFFVTTGSFKANTNFDFSFARSGQIALPNFVPVYGGTKIANSNFAINYTNNNTSADDYAAGWGQYNISTPWDQYNITLGLRINFDGSIARIGSGNIPTTSSWFVTGGRDYVMLTAMWDNDTPGVEVKVIRPDGTVIEEADFTANRIAIVDDFTSGTARTVIIDAPEEGTWDLEIVDTTGLGSVMYEATGAVELPEFAFTGTPLVNADGTVTYTFDATTTTPVTNVTYYYDDDLSELDGLYAGSGVLSDGAGSFTWDAAQVVPGSYFLYALVDDGSGPIVIVENPNAVTVGSEADLSVTFDSDVQEARAGDTVQLTITVQNLSTDTDADDARAYVNLPDDVALSGSSLPLASSDISQYEVDLGDIAAGGTATVTIDVIVNSGATPGDQFAGDVYVLADTYDAETENDGDAVQFIVPADAAPDPVDLSIDSKIDEASSLTVDQFFTYTVSITNTGTTTATGVVLSEVVQGLNSVSATPAGSFSGGTLTVQVGTLAAGQTVDVEVSAVAPSAGLVFTTSSVTADGVDTAITDNEEVNVESILGASPDEIDLSLILTDATVAQGLGNTLNLSVRNDGPGIASDVEVQLNLPAGASVTNTSSIQGTYDSTTGIWSLGNMRDNLTRTLTLSVIGLTGQTITAEVIAVGETDVDSTPNDGQGDDFDTLSGVFSGLSGEINGTDGDDILTAANTDDTIDAGAGDDQVRPNGGVDEMTLGEGADQVIGTAGSLDGDTITDLALEDTLVFEGVSFGKDDVTVDAGPPPVLRIDTDGDSTAETEIFLGGLPGDDVFVWQRGGDTRLAFQDDLADIREGAALEADDINGITNHDILTGDGSATFSATVDGRATTANANTLGVYEIDASGAIVDVRVLVNDVADASGSLAITGVEAGHTLGFFIISDGDSFADTLSGTETLSFVDGDDAAGNADAGLEIFLAVNGAVQSLNVFHSHDAALNPGAIQHAISGLSADGSSLIVGFEDTPGGGDQDYQDVLFSVDIL